MLWLPALFMIQNGELGFFGRADVGRNLVLYAWMVIVSDEDSNYGRQCPIHGQEQTSSPRMHGLSIYFGNLHAICMH